MLTQGLASAASNSLLIHSSRSCRSHRLPAGEALVIDPDSD
jgi:hypothetical protein